MARRFPPGQATLPTEQIHYQRVLQLVDRAPDPLPAEEFRDAFQVFIREPESGDKYGDAWVRRTISELETAGVIRQTEASELSNASHLVTETDDPEVVTLWPGGKEYLRGALSFEEFMWRSVKRGWLVNGGAPEKIEGLERILKVLLEAETALEVQEIKRHLVEQYDYEFSSRGIRGHPNLLRLMGAIESVDNGYVSTDAGDSYLQKFRSTDFFRIFERWIQREGPTGVLPQEATKRDIAKYYLYRESGGWGKQSGWLKSFWREYLDSSARNGDTKRPNLKRATPYIEADNERGDLREQIKTSHDIGTDQLRGLSTEILRRMATADSAVEASRILAASGTGVSRSDLDLLADPARDRYEFPAEFTLYDWQQAAADKWFSSSRGKSQSGIAQVVTGAGKTVMALEILGRWLDENPDGVVTVVVPTKVLMQQWLTELVEKLNVPVDDIGWAGDGTRDSFSDGCRILVSIVNTAVKNDYLRETLAAAGDPPHLLIADECHRYTSEVFSNIFSYPRTASLGLSATPTSTLVTDPSEPKSEASATASDEVSTERSDADLTAEDELLLDELGEIYYSLTYDEALEQDLIPPFEVCYVRFDLTQPERNQYEVFSRKVSDAISDIEARYGDRLYQLNGNYAQKLNTIMNSADGPTPAIGDFFEFTQKRRELVANAVSRQAITLSLLEDAIDNDNKSIVFQERIEQLEQLIAPHEQRGRNPRTGELSSGASTRQELYEQYPDLKEIDLAVEELFGNPNYKPVMYHSGHSRTRWNDFAMEWFRDEGFANTMLSVKALIEGVDVPSADIGIVRVSSSSLRQRIQTLGRVLRTGGDATKRSKLYVLYARDTVDENLFKEYDWDEQLANADVSHLEWQTHNDQTLNGEIVPTDDPLPTVEATQEPEVPDPDELERGDPYPGPRRGFEFSVDSDGRPFRKDGDQRKYITDEPIQAIGTYVRDIKGGGTVTVNKANHMLTQISDGPVFLGIASDPESFSYEEDSENSLTDDAPDSLDFM